MEFSELYKAVIELYKENKSVKQTADILQVSVVKVRRILITEGLWHSETSDAICKLYKQGLSTDEIAVRLGIGRKNVQAYIPYTRGVYGEFESDDSIRSNLYRERKQGALDAQITTQAASGTPSNIIDMRDYFAMRKVDVLADNPQLEIGKSIPFSPQGEYTYELKLELVQRSYEESDYESLETLPGNEYQNLLQLSKAKSGISRTVLVPSDITLHSLNYLIQKAFGFLNGHLHSFNLLNSDFNTLTEGKYNKWLYYQGCLFRTPDEQSDIFWDDDYDGRKSINSWLKGKYKPPYIDLCASDTYLYQKERLKVFEDFASHNLGIKSSMLKILSLDELYHKLYLPGGFDSLIERLTVGELLYPEIKQIDINGLKEQLRQSINHATEKYSELSKDNQRCLIKNIIQLTKEYAGMYAVKSGQYDPEQMDDTPEEYLSDCEFFIEELNKYIWPAVEITNPKIEPFTSRILYTYDFGDDWNILITCINRSAGKIDTPVCIEADGLNLIDNSGGIGGYIDILREINGESGTEASKNAKGWARSMGFTGRKSKPENIL